MALLWTVSLSAGELGRVNVTADRVSLRAEPDLNAVLMDRTMSGDLLTIKDNSNLDWVGVSPPSSVDVWVLHDFIQNDKVSPAHLNVRSGPSLNHSVVGVIHQGDSVIARGDAGGWLRIAPPETTVVWISRTYTKGAKPVTKPKPVAHGKPKPISIIPPPESEIVPEQIEVEDQVVQPEINEMLIVAATVLETPNTLIPDPYKMQGVKETFAGVLQTTDSSLFKLMSTTQTNIPVCYVRGNQKQMTSHMGRHLTITGKTYWAEGLELPFVIPSKIAVPRSTRTTK